MHDNATRSFPEPDGPIYRAAADFLAEHAFLVPLADRLAGSDIGAQYPGTQRRADEHADAERPRHRANADPDLTPGFAPDLDRYSELTYGWDYRWNAEHGRHLAR